MLQLSKRSEYGLIALVHLTDRRGQIVSAREIAERHGVPRRLLAEVLKDLCRAGIVESTRGAQGGYSLARPATQISLGQVIGAIDGDVALTPCEDLRSYLVGSCDVESTCPIQGPLDRLRAGISGLLQRTTLQDLARGVVRAEPVNHRAS
jgi:Rrf2 family protein